MTAPLERACKASRDALDAVTDGRADFGVRDGLERHAASCAPCARELSEALLLRRLLETLSEPEATRIGEDAFVEAIMNRIDGPASVKTGRPSPLLLVGAAVAVAAAAALIVAIWSSFDSVAPSNAARDESVAAAPAGDAPPAFTKEAESDRTAPHTAPEPLPVPPDLVVFRAALSGAALATGFAHEDTVSVSVFSREVSSRYDGDLAPAARALLFESETTDFTRLAARLLGPRADARDRRLLLQSMERCGAASAWALVDRGRTGTTELWRLATAPAPDALKPAPVQTDRATARKVLLEAAELGRLDRGFPRAIQRDPALAAALTSVSKGGAADRLLDEFLRSGDAAWFDAWVAHDDRAGALGTAIKQHTPRRTTRVRCARLIRAIGAVAPTDDAALALVVDGLDRGIAESAPALARLDGPDPARALLDASHFGLLKDHVEDAAWRAMIDADSDRLLAALFEDESSTNEYCSTLYSAVLRISSDGLNAGTRAVLIGLATRESVDASIRARTLILLAASPAENELVNARTREALSDLRRHDAPSVAAGAWLAWVSHGGVPDESFASLHSALAEEGILAARHSRLTRSIRRGRLRRAAW